MDFLCPRRSLLFRHAIKENVNKGTPPSQTKSRRVAPEANRPVFGPRNKRTMEPQFILFIFSVLVFFLKESLRIFLVAFSVMRNGNVDYKSRIK